MARPQPMSSVRLCAPRSAALALLLLAGCSDLSMMSRNTGDVDDGEERRESDDALPVRELPAPVDECSAAEAPPLWLSPDDANSMSSPVLARAGMVGEGIRTYEFMNYYTFGYAPAAPGSLTVDLQLVETDEPGLYELQIGVASPVVQERAPMNLVFSVDRSGSMSGRPIELLQAAGREIAGRLDKGDVVSMVSWDTGRNVVLSEHAVDGPDDPELMRAFSGLSANGATDLESGLQTAYDLALRQFDPGRINRVVLMSDGGANTGVTDEQLIADMAGAQDEAGIYLVGLGFGTGDTYSDLLMDTVTDEGKGAALYLNSEAEITRMLGGRFDEVFGVAARSVELELKLPPGFEIVRFSGEEYSENREEVRPQNLGPEDTMVFYQTIRGCADADPASLRVEATVHWLDPERFEARSVSAGAGFDALLAAPHAELLKGRAVFLTAEAMKGTVSVEEALEALGEAMEAAPKDAELVELAAMLP